jgi:hypothetical protein
LAASTSAPGRSAVPHAPAPTWPIAAFLLGFPLWWLLGLTSVILIVVAVPMAMWLRRLRRIVVPPGFGWWLLFLLCVVLSVSMLGLTAPGTISGSFAGRLPAFTLRLLNYVAATVVMLYIINASESTLSTRRLVRMQAVFFVIVVLGGLLGTFFYNIAFTSPLAYVLPSSLTSHRFVSSLLHPSVAQLQGVLGFESPRPSAPFVYTNIWGNNLSLLMVWFVIANWVWGGTGRRLFCGVVLAVSSIPIIYSLNRGLWIGLGAAVLYLSVRSALQGRVRILVATVVVAGVALMGVVASPLYGVVQERLAHPHSNEARQNTSLAAVDAAVASPVLGFGSTRSVVGSAQTIAVGRSESCPQCGNAAIGGAGQMWLLLVAQGFLGLILYVGFFVRTLWTYRHDRSPVAMGATLVIGLGLLYLPVYGSVGTPLALYMIAVALLWRQRRLSAPPRRSATDHGPAVVVGQP